MKCSLGISNFLEVISSLSHSVVFLYFFALITEGGFLISAYSSLELCIQMCVSFLFSFIFFTSLLFTLPRLYCSFSTSDKINRCLKECMYKLWPFYAIYILWQFKILVLFKSFQSFRIFEQKNKNHR